MEKKIKYNYSLSSSEFDKMYTKVFGDDVYSKYYRVDENDIVLEVGGGDVGMYALRSFEYKPKKHYILDHSEHNISNIVDNIRVNEPSFLDNICIINTNQETNYTLVDLVNKYNLHDVNFLKISNPYLIDTGNVEKTVNLFRKYDKIIIDIDNSFFSGGKRNINILFKILKLSGFIIKITNCEGIKVSEEVGEGDIIIHAKKINLRVSTSFIGKGGYNNHARDLFTRLSERMKISIRNFTVGDKYIGRYANNQHDVYDYVDDKIRKLLDQQTLIGDGGRMYDYDIYTDYENDVKPDMELILNESNHHYFHQDYNLPSIAYIVWESTEYGNFRHVLNKFDNVWVASHAQKDWLVDEGSVPKNITIVPEGVDVNKFNTDKVKPLPDLDDGRFKFMIFGRYDYRKSTSEMIDTFLKTFSPEEPVDLILSIDNPHSGDGCETTEDRLKMLGYDDERLKILHFPSREDYINYMKNGHVFLSCARSEGWNLPLIEAMACGTPSIYSLWGGQLEFTKGTMGLPVKVKGELPAKMGEVYNMFYTQIKIGGFYGEPDFDDLSRVMRDAYSNYDSYKLKAMEESKFIREEYNWDRVADLATMELSNFLSNLDDVENDIDISFYEGVKVEINGKRKRSYYVKFIDDRSNDVVYETEMNTNCWSSPSIQYYKEWRVEVYEKEGGELIVSDKLNLVNNKVLIKIESNSVGDNLAFMPYVEEFRKKHNCEIYCMTFYNGWFVDKYPNIHFVGTSYDTSDIYASYKIGWFRNEQGVLNRYDMNPNDVRTIPMQKTAADILGLDYVQIRPELSYNKVGRLIEDRYITIGPESTAGCKQWHDDHWQQLIDYLHTIGYKVVSLSKRGTGFRNAWNAYNMTIDETISLIDHSEFFIGLGSGLSWVAWTLRKKHVMIANFSEQWHEYEDKNMIRITNTSVCHGCWNDTTYNFDRGDWNWCPRSPNMKFECQLSITPMVVIKSLKNKKYI